MGAVPQTSPMAIASLVTAIVCCGPLGIIFGILSKKEIKESNGQKTGDGLALAGIIIGAVTTVFYAFWALGVLALIDSGYYYDF
jgi:VIT1/CCC1 family predicted Fe2+/Mn2+ transporter